MKTVLCFFPFPTISISLSPASNGPRFMAKASPFRIPVSDNNSAKARSRRPVMLLMLMDCQTLSNSSSVSVSGLGLGFLGSLKRFLGFCRTTLHMQTLEHTQSNSQMSFTHAGRTEKDDVAAFMQEAACGQFVDELFVDRRLLLEVEGVEPFLIGQVGELQIQAHSFFVTETQLSIEQVAEEVSVGPTGSSGLLSGLV